jgi:hypothetical protein
MRAGSWARFREAATAAAGARGSGRRAPTGDELATLLAG